MLRRIAFNTGVSAAAYLFVSIVGLVLVPLLVSKYGLTLFGLIVLARVFLPSAGLAFLDFGFGEAAVISVAQARARGNWEEASRQLSLLLCAAVTAGAAAGAVIAAFAGVLASWFDVPASETGSFVSVLHVTGVVLPICFASLVLEGILKGFERFGAQRASEVTSTMTYAAGAVIAVATDADFESVSYALIFSLLIRTALVAILLRQHLGRGAISFRRWTARDAQIMWPRCRSVGFGRFLGTLQTQVSPIVIGLLLGPAPVAVYDVLGRLPRFIKSVLGLATGILLPLAIRLDSAGDTANHQRLGEVGIVAILLVSFPPLMAGIIFSEPILRLWIGSEISSMWIWQSLLFLFPILTVLTSFGSNALLGRQGVLRRINKLLFIQILIQFSFAFALMSLWGERAFIFGQVAAAALVFPFQMGLIVREQDLAAEVPALLVRTGALALITMVGVSWFEGARVTNTIELAVGAAATALVYLCIIWLLVLKSRHRAEVRSVVSGVFRKEG